MTIDREVLQDTAAVDDAGEEVSLAIELSNHVFDRRECSIRWINPQDLQLIVPCRCRGDRQVDREAAEGQRIVRVLRSEDR